MNSWYFWMPSLYAPWFGCSPHPDIFEYHFDLIHADTSCLVQNSDAMTFYPKEVAVDESEANLPRWNRTRTFTTKLPCSSATGLVADDIDKIDQISWSIAGPYPMQRYWGRDLGKSLERDLHVMIKIGDCESEEILAEGILPAGTETRETPGEISANYSFYESAYYRPAADDVITELNTQSENEAFTKMIKSNLVQNTERYHTPVDNTVLSYNLSICSDLELSNDSEQIEVKWLHLSTFRITGSGHPCSLPNEEP